MAERPALPQQLIDTGVVAIARAATTARLSDAVEALVDAGVTCVEVTLTTPDAVASVAELAKRFGADACIGAGTVLTMDQAMTCIDAGAAFLVAPSLVPDVVAASVEAGIPCLPGALTPSEIVGAWGSGAAAVKLFPASLGGPGYVRDVRAPLPGIPLVPTGGVAIDRVPDYLRAGAVAVGMGSPLFGAALDEDAGATELTALVGRASRLLDAVHTARAESNS